MIPGIGVKLQRHLRRCGIFTWDDFLRAFKIPGFSTWRKREIDAQLRELKSQLFSLNSRFFARILPASAHWLLFPHFRDYTIFLDIETTGIGEFAHTTVLGMADSSGYRCFIRGINLTADELKKAFSRGKMLVSFHGTGFDLPFLKREFPDLPIYSLPHFDLCPAGRKVGLKGGLKKVEAVLGLNRSPEVVGMGGYEAVLLWDSYLRGNKKALEQLVLYNQEDVCNLIPLAEIIYQRLSESENS